MRKWLLPLGAMTAAVLIAYAGTGLFRVYEVPWTPPSYAQAADVLGTSNSSLVAFRDGLNEEQRIQLLSPLTTSEIATRLSLSVKTIETHRKNVMDKLHTRSIAQLTKFAIQSGLTTLEN